MTCCIEGPCLVDANDAIWQTVIDIEAGTTSFINIATGSAGTPVAPTRTCGDDDFTTACVDIPAGTVTDFTAGVAAMDAELQAYVAANGVVGDFFTDAQTGAAYVVTDAGVCCISAPNVIVECGWTEYEANTITNNVITDLGGGLFQIETEHGAVFEIDLSGWVALGLFTDPAPAPANPTVDLNLATFTDDRAYPAAPFRLVTPIPGVSAGPCESLHLYLSALVDADVNTQLTGWTGGVTSSCDRLPATGTGFADRFGMNDNDFVNPNEPHIDTDQFVQGNSQNQNNAASGYNIGQLSGDDQHLWFASTQSNGAGTNDALAAFVRSYIARPVQIIRSPKTGDVIASLDADGNAATAVFTEADCAPVSIAPYTSQSTYAIEDLGLRLNGGNSLCVNPSFRETRVSTQGTDVITVAEPTGSFWRESTFGEVVVPCAGSTILIQMEGAASSVQVRDGAMNFRSQFTLDGGTTWISFTDGGLDTYRHDGDPGEIVAEISFTDQYIASVRPAGSYTFGTRLELFSYSGTPTGSLVFATVTSRAIVNEMRAI